MRISDWSSDVCSSDLIDADQDQNAVEQAANNIANHGFLAVSVPARAVALSRRRATCQAMTPPTASKAASSHKGHQTGAFHCLIFCARKAGSIRKYCSVLRTIWVGLALPTQAW